MLHYKACARTRKAKIADVALMIFGAVAAVYTTAQTIRVHADYLFASVPLLTHSPSLWRNLRPTVARNLAIVTSLRRCWPNEQSGLLRRQGGWILGLVSFLL